ncbi:MAG: ribosomal protein S18-alanine N-acetyltransferase [Tenericutes bacterium]|jgi:ribosomal-protein-alanine N-acetyltransferase|nr:ribosomal protein S18-alanine N-acetyltransferase [Mycoplasmatota bacterium]
MIDIKVLENKDLLDVIAYENEYFNITNYEMFIETYVENPLFEIYGIYKYNILIGYIIIWLDEDKSQIYSMLINEKYRRNGYGFKALLKLENILSDKHIKEWTLEVRASNNAAIQLYKKVGFKSVAERKNYYKNNENALLMYKKL